VRGIVVLLLALAGCDRVFFLQHVDDEARDAGDDGNGPADLLISDGPTYAACQTPFPAMGPGAVVLPGYSEGTRADVAAFGVALSAGNAYYFTDADVPVPLGPQNGTWSRPSLTPDGSQLYMFNSSGQTYRFAHGSGSTWAAGVSTDPTIGFTNRPGNVGVVPGTNEMRMMVFEGTELREHASTDGGVTWDLSSSRTRSVTELTGLAGGTIDYQGLTSDAATLLFTVTGTGTGQDGVWYIRRTDFDIDNNFSTANTSEYGPLLALSGAKTPYLDPNCSLFVGVGNDLLQYDPL
jgi:hypothetical protein